MAKSNIARKENKLPLNPEERQNYLLQKELIQERLSIILDRKISNIHHSTVEKVANFFGTTYDIIEDYDIEEIKINSIGF